jgi:glycosyltransferase involved in cell wall biosynthesis
MRKKVIEFMSALSDGGAETLVKDYACLLDKNRFDVTIACIYAVTDTANYRRVKDNKLSTYYIFKKHNICTQIFRRVLGEWYIPFCLKKLIKQEKPDVIHIHLRNLKYFRKISSHLKGIRLFYTCHNVPELMLGDKFKAEKEAAKYLIKNNDLRLIALHKEMACELNEMFGISDTSIVRNGVDFNKFRNVKSDKTTLRNRYSIPQNAFVVGNIGRFSTQKNQHKLLDFVYEIQKRGIPGYLLIIGSGELENNIREKISDLGLNNSVLMLSHRTDIPELLKCMDVFVFPSLYEGLSVTLVEAQASGLRCVVSDRINEETILTDKTLVVPLEATDSEWVDMILDEKLVNA